jgi:hypothetical protein
MFDWVYTLFDLLTGIGSFFPCFGEAHVDEGAQAHAAFPAVQNEAVEPRLGCAPATVGHLQVQSIAVMMKSRLADAVSGQSGHSLDARHDRVVHFYSRFNQRFS